MFCSRFKHSEFISCYLKPVDSLVLFDFDLIRGCTWLWHLAVLVRGRLVFVQKTQSRMQHNEGLTTDNGPGTTDAVVILRPKAPRPAVFSGLFGWRGALNSQRFQLACWQEVALFHRLGVHEVCSSCRHAYRRLAAIPQKYIFKHFPVFFCLCFATSKPHIKVLGKTVGKAFFLPLSCCAKTAVGCFR